MFSFESTMQYLGSSNSDLIQKLFRVDAQAKVAAAAAAAVAKALALAAAVAWTAASVWFTAAAMTSAGD